MPVVVKTEQKKLFMKMVEDQKGLFEICVGSLVTTISQNQLYKSVWHHIIRTEKGNGIKDTWMVRFVREFFSSNGFRLCVPSSVQR